MRIVKNGHSIKVEISDRFQQGLQDCPVFTLGKHEMRGQSPRKAETRAEGGRKGKSKRQS
jgi:hypothetical protein